MKLRYAIYLSLALISIILPVLLYDSALSYEFFGSTHQYSMFKLFAFFASISIIAVSGCEIKKNNYKDFKSAVPILLIAGVCLHYLIIMTEFPNKSWDYLCYENASRNYLQYLNPYEGTYYLYPPLLVQGLSLAWRVIISVFSFDGDLAWKVLFYFFQSVQFLLLVMLGVLSYLFSRRLQMSPIVSAVVTSVLFMFNNPLIRALEYNQVSLAITNCILLSMLLTNRYPVIAGVISSIAVHIKIFPILMLFPWWARKNFRAMAGLVIGVIVFPLFSLINQDFLSYEQFLRSSLNSFETVPFIQYGYFRDNSINSVVHSLLVIIEGIADYKFPVIVQKSLTILISLGVFSLYLIRIKARENQGNVERETVFYGHVMDTLAAILLLSPLSWEHYYLLSMPLFIWGFYICGFTKEWLQLLSFVFVLCLPTIDVFPFGYNRIIGLFIILYLIKPRRAYVVINKTAAEV